MGKRIRRLINSLRLIRLINRLLTCLTLSTLKPRSAVTNVACFKVNASCAIQTGITGTLIYVYGKVKRTNQSFHRPLTTFIWGHMRVVRMKEEEKRRKIPPKTTGNPKHVKTTTNLLPNSK